MTTIAGYEVHPAAAIFPMLDSLELAKLSRDIAENGQIHPVVVQGNTLLDGRNRLLACKMACIEPWIVEWNGEGSVVAYIASTNIRRNLTESQRAMIAADLLPMLEAEAAERSRANLRRGKERPESPSPPVGGLGTSAAVAAEATGVGTRSVERAKKVATEAPELADQVRAGEVSLRGAEQQLASKLLGGSAKGRGPETDEANTPDEILGLVRAVARIGVDPCWNATANTRPRLGYSIDDNGLEQEWRVESDEIVWVNYPFSESESWVAKVLAESERSPIVLLSKIDTRVAWWKSLRMHPNYRARVQLDGYFKYGGSPNPATFSTALWLVAPDDALVERFARTMHRAGEMVYPLKVGWAA